MLERVAAANLLDPSGYCGVDSVGSFLESINPISEENCAYQAAETLKNATNGKVDLAGWLTEPAFVDTASVATCLAPPPIDAACGPGMIYAFGTNATSIIAEERENGFCNIPRFLAKEGANALLFTFAGLASAPAKLSGAGLGTKVIIRAGPAAAQVTLDGAQYSHGH